MYIILIRPCRPRTAQQIEIYNCDLQSGGDRGEKGFVRLRVPACVAAPLAPAWVKKQPYTLTSELLFNHQGILMACQSNEIWLEATWCKHYDKSLSHKPTQGLMVINHHFGERKMTAIKIMNGMINFSH